MPNTPFNYAFKALPLGNINSESSLHKLTLWTYRFPAPYRWHPCFDAFFRVPQLPEYEDTHSDPNVLILEPYNICPILAHGLHPADASFLYFEEGSQMG